MSAITRIKSALIDKQKSLRIGQVYCQSFRNPSIGISNLINQYQKRTNEVSILYRLIQELDLRHQLDTPSTAAKLDHLAAFLDDAASQSHRAEHSLGQRIKSSKARCEFRASPDHDQTIANLLKLLGNIESCLKAASALASTLNDPNLPATAAAQSLPHRESDLSTSSCNDAQSQQSDQDRSVPVSQTAVNSPAFLVLTSGEEPTQKSGSSQLPTLRLTPLDKLKYENYILRLQTKSERYITTDWNTDTSHALIAARSGDHRLLVQLFRDDPEVKRSRNQDDVGIMGIAIEAGQTRLVEFLLDIGFDINEKFGRFGSTPLSESLRCRKLAITKLLVRNNASFTTRNSMKQTPIYALWAEESKNKPSTEYIDLLRTRADFASIHEGVVDEDGWSVFQRAACFGTKEDVDHLLHLSFNPLATIQRTGIATGHTEHEGWSTLHLAAWYGNFESVKLLGRHYYAAKQVDVEDPHGCTALHMAVHREHLHIAVFLLLLGACPLQAAKHTWLQGDATPSGPGHTAFKLALHTRPEFREPFLNWMAFLQLPFGVVPSSMKIRSKRSDLVRRIESCHDPLPPPPPPLPPPDPPAPFVASVGHTFGDVNTTEGNVLQGDQHVQNATTIFNIGTLVLSHSPGVGSNDVFAGVNLSVSRRILGMELKVSLALKPVA